ncbi:MAG: DUF2157 domain-containing protein [Ghiorsea sp.]|nr:DUF2157 domain-containing protein [Ghiorsea sp.]
MGDTRFLIAEFIKRGLVSEDPISYALRVSKLTPERQGWLSLLDRFLLVIGAMALVSALTFFIAYNWAEMSRLVKFSLVEIFIILSIFAYWKLSAHQFPAKIALLTASLLLGVLLALYGQTYQTGADAWQLFFNWALLILPWVLLAQFSVLWIVFLFLLNLSLILYMGMFGGLFFGLAFASELHWPLFGLNAVALLVWEYMSQTKVWLQSIWAPRLLAVVSGASITVLVLYYIVSPASGSFFSMLIWLNYLVVLYLYYRKKKPDLFMLAGGCLSASSVIITFIAQYIDAASSLIFALLIIALAGSSSMWLKHIQKEMQS